MYIFNKNHVFLCIKFSCAVNSGSSSIDIYITVVCTKKSTKDILSKISKESQIERHDKHKNNKRCRWFERRSIANYYFIIEIIKIIVTSISKSILLLYI